MACGCPAGRAHATANGLFHFPPRPVRVTEPRPQAPSPSPCSPRPPRPSDEGWEQRMTATTAPPQSQSLSSWQSQCSRCGAVSSGQWCGRSAHLQTNLPIIALSATRSIGSVRGGEDIGNDERGRGGGRRVDTHSSPWPSSVRAARLHPSSAALPSSARTLRPSGLVGPSPGCP